MKAERCALTKIYHFSAAHRLHCEKFSDHENRCIFGKCNNPKGHGHDYYVEVQVGGDIDPDSGMIINLCELDGIMSGIIEELDHKRLDVEIPFFLGERASGENIVKYIWQRLEPQLNRGKLRCLKLWETPDNYFEYFEDGAGYTSEGI
ncbi:MAG: 6-carboxytetrahydropterin synthase [Deltaproteobacteria bacterium]